MATVLRLLALTTTRRAGVASVALPLVLLFAIAAGISLGGKTVDDFTVPGIESQKAQDLIGQRFAGEGGDSATLVFTGSLDGARQVAAIRAAVAEIRRQPHVTTVDDPHSA